MSCAYARATWLKSTMPVWGDGRQVGRFVLELPYDSIGLLIPTEDRATAVSLADKLGSLLVNGAG